MLRAGEMCSPVVMHGPPSVVNRVFITAGALYARLVVVTCRADKTRPKPLMSSPYTCYCDNASCTTGRIMVGPYSWCNTFLLYSVASHVAVDQRRIDSRGFPSPVKSYTSKSIIHIRARVWLDRVCMATGLHLEGFDKINRQHSI